MLTSVMPCNAPAANVEGCNLSKRSIHTSCGIDALKMAVRVSRGISPVRVKPFTAPKRARAMFITRDVEMLMRERFGVDGDYNIIIDSSAVPKDGDICAFANDYDADIFIQPYTDAGGFPILIGVAVMLSLPRAA